MSVLTRLGLYSNMLITEIKSTDTSETFRGLQADVTLREIPVARVKTVKISQAPQTTQETELGKVESFKTTKELESYLSMLLGYVFGGGQ